MTDFYTSMQGVANGLLTKYKQGTLLLRRESPGAGPAYNPGPPTITDYPVNGVVSGMSQYENATLIAIADRVATIQVPTVPPLMSDKFVVDGLEYQIAKIDRIPEAGTACAYKIFLKA